MRHTAPMAASEYRRLGLALVFSGGLPVLRQDMQHKRGWLCVREGQTYAGHGVLPEWEQKGNGRTR